MFVHARESQGKFFNCRDTHGSVIDTIFKFSDIVPMWLQRLIEPVSRMMGMIDTIIKRGVFEGDYKNRQRVIEILKQHTENDINTVPPARLLVFDVKQGWEPLCRFLDVPVPDSPFPHVNDTEEFKAMNRRMYRLFHCGPAAVGMILLVVIGLLGAWLRYQAVEKRPARPGHGWHDRKSTKQVVDLARASTGMCTGLATLKKCRKALFQQPASLLSHK